MSKSLFGLSMCLLLVSQALPAFADGYDDCLQGCGDTVAPCVEQIRLTAGNIQEEEDGVAACEKSKKGCIQSCKDAETTPSSPPAPPPQQQPGVSGVDFDSDIKTYDNKGIKTYEFK